MLRDTDAPSAFFILAEHSDLPSDLGNGEIGLGGKIVD
jgi:hypothetical protein